MYFENFQYSNHRWFILTIPILFLSSLKVNLTKLMQTNYEQSDYSLGLWFCFLKWKRKRKITVYDWKSENLKVIERWKKKKRWNAHFMLIFECFLNQNQSFRDNTAVSLKKNENNMTLNYKILTTLNTIHFRILLWIRYGVYSYNIEHQKSV